MPSLLAGWSTLVILHQRQFCPPGDIVDGMLVACSGQTPGRLLHTLLYEQDRPPHKKNYSIQNVKSASVEKL